MILWEINPEYLFKGLMLKLKLQYFGHLNRTADSLKSFLSLEKTEGRKRRGHQKLGGLTDAVYMNLGKLWEMMKDREAWLVAFHGLQKVRQHWVTEQ